MTIVSFFWKPCFFTQDKPFIFQTLLICIIHFFIYIVKIWIHNHYLSLLFTPPALLSPYLSTPWRGKKICQNAVSSTVSWHILKFLNQDDFKLTASVQTEFLLFFPFEGESQFCLRNNYRRKDKAKTYQHRHGNPLTIKTNGKHYPKNRFQT